MHKDTPQNTDRFNERPEKKFEERIITIRRVSKKTTGGNYVSFSALVAIGDGKGNVAIGVGRGLEVPPAIQKAIAQAKKKMVFLPAYKDTIPHMVLMKYKAARLLLKPAPPGTGLKVGGVVRVILDLAGINNASGKIIGSRNQITNAYAVMEAIKMFKPRISAEDKMQAVQPEPVKETPKKEEKKVVKEEVKPVVEEAKTEEPKTVEPKKEEVKTAAKPKRAKKAAAPKTEVTEEPTK
jgi:small subunit ribosomal protein S5